MKLLQQEVSILEFYYFRVSQENFDSFITVTIPLILYLLFMKMIVKFTEYVPSFGVYNDTLYWIYPKQKALFACNRANCIHPGSYKNVSKDYPTAVVGITNFHDAEAYIRIYVRI